MVNKPHAPRGSKGNKKSGGTAAAANGEDTSYIVFGKDDKGSKKGNKSAPVEDNGEAAKGAKGKDTTKAGPLPEAEKKPDTRTLIAGSSWTGKLPMTLFNEHCQKQRWEKPEYIMHRTKSGKFAGGVILRQKNQKTQEVTQLPEISPPREYNNEKGGQDSAVEARHFAATYALFRVGNAKNLSMALPPQYRDLWKGDFQDLKKEAVANGQGYLYDADPFLALKQRDEARAAKDKERAEVAKRKQQAEKQSTVTLDGQIRRPDKGWGKSPRVEMGVKTRRDVENMIRGGAVWNVHDIHMSEEDRQDAVKRLAQIGFRPSHAEEATTICADFEECLEWLLIHLPEDDVPKWALPENYLAGVALVASDVQKDSKIKRLAEAGYSRDICSDVLESSNGDEDKAALILQRRLLGEEPVDTNSNPGCSETWEEEQATLEAIYGERYQRKDRNCIIQLELQTTSNEPISLRVRPSLDYPNEMPAIAVEAPLPAYIKLSILRQCLLHAQQHFLGEMMLFNILDWLEQEIPRIIEEPDKLQNLAGATATSNDPSKGGPSRTHKKPRSHPRPIVWTKDTPASQRMQSEWLAKQDTPDQQRMMQARQGLPAWRLRDAVVSSVRASQVTIISGETGSGKSTQSVQFVLDDLIKQGFAEQANIICTQPRRISALGLADRVADERCGKVGDEVGYTIRGESKQKAGLTRITFVTTGVLLRRLQTSGGSADDVVRSLADVSHVVIDEVHERSLDTDFLLVLLRDVLAKRKDLKLILMSATLDADVFESYFSRVSSVGRVEIEGRTHPVQDVYVDEIRQLVSYGSIADEDADSDLGDDLVDDFSVAGGRKLQQKPKPQKQYGQIGHDGHNIDYDMIARVVQHIDSELGRADGGILIFLPGTMEIDRTLRSLMHVPNLHALPLHAGLQSVEQKRVFSRPPKGLRKVVCATNVAETSITIDDIVAVVDTGRVKETSFDPTNNMVRLTEMWASRAACKQRRGRAGRVRAGKAYKLYTKKQEAQMLERPDPEIRRVPLEQLCLSVKAMGVIDVPAFLASALTPPESLSVTGALNLLERVGALEKNELTALGRHMSMIPADLRVGKLMVLGAAFGCLDACLTVAATLTVKSPFVSPQAKREEAKEAKSAFGRGHGDLMCDLHAYEEWFRRRAKGEATSLLRKWCDANFLNHQTLLDISSNRNQYASSLQEIGFLPPGHMAHAEAPNRHNDSDALLRALIAGAFQPQLARIEFPEKKFVASAAGSVAQDPEAHTIKYFNEENGRVFVHPGSTLFSESSFPASSVFMSYFTKMATSKIFIRDLTPFNVFSLLMFGGPVTIDPQGRGLLVDGWVRLRGWARIGVLVSRLRMMLDDLLARKVDEPGLDMSEAAIVKVVRRMVTFDGLDR
ncbi:P-loop containing nucleoside triphosphate hydrolase protein [Hortaea werneckii]|uniref:RNA helicase n=1 Tax=Hortaea werneckii TaxID=91943 RepID=A0A3M7I9A5_HORWE|nr:P-loop containing nucleoside triphosphate hydrolase protein [Hortaea werneckii]KAI6809662.1 P-loop containing nucleoside triphosphate hydrolase protein [Hortaea werneckii]KAI6902780.1 P-loop containing nucleoside triphosphate hydrolase protein [Hortaea werneckii]KAI6927005.1 P-loop containing nucleoside triphosphate hydrolase protein [Hortaea werneckii]KAI6962320.1 P-loop containing nucleoside triphosphate hydrolase protein [Hortaea werneckii]